jgi:CheY-like chemotaxis protein
MKGNCCDELAGVQRSEHPKVLVVDDDPLTQWVLQHYLKRVGYKMVSAENGRDALRMARQESPQLIILDIIMPDRDGWTVLRQLKRFKATRDIPVVLLSGNAELMAKEESLKSGATQLLVKPISPDQLLRVMNRLVPCPRCSLQNA